MVHSREEEDEDREVVNAEDHEDREEVHEEVHEVVGLRHVVPDADAVDLVRKMQDLREELVLQVVVLVVDRRGLVERLLDQESFHPFLQEEVRVVVVLAVDLACAGAEEILEVLVVRDAFLIIIIVNLILIFKN